MTIERIRADESQEVRIAAMTPEQRGRFVAIMSGGGTEE